ncbi:8647_t:CDS:2, partial [Cetraspora pellucida]
KHVVEWERGIKRQRKDTLSMSESISLLTNIIFKREILGNHPPIISFSKLRSVAEGKNNQLNFFFDEIEAMVCLRRKSYVEQKALDWSLAYQYEVADSDNNLTWIGSINILTKLLYNREKNEEKLAIYSFKQMCREM